MYVELDSSSLMESKPPTEVFAELRFFVYNKKQNKYFTKGEVYISCFSFYKFTFKISNGCILYIFQMLK